MTHRNLSEPRALAYRSALADKGKIHIAFVGVLPTESDAPHLPPMTGALGIAVSGEPGYHPIPIGWAHYVSMDAAQTHAEHLNKTVLNLSERQQAEIIASTMGSKLKPTVILRKKDREPKP